MIDTLLNLVFRCAHRRLTRPLTPVSRQDVPCDTYVVCLDCGKQFEYDLNEMRIGKAIPSPSNSKMKYALAVAAPVAAVAITSVLTAKLSGPKKEGPEPSVSGAGNPDTPNDR